MTMGRSRDQKSVVLGRSQCGVRERTAKDSDGFEMNRFQTVPWSYLVARRRRIYGDGSRRVQWDAMTVVPFVCDRSRETVQARCRSRYKPSVGFDHEAISSLRSYKIRLTADTWSQSTSEHDMHHLLPIFRSSFSASTQNFLFDDLLSWLVCESNPDASAKGGVLLLDGSDVGCFRVYLGVFC